MKSVKSVKGKYSWDYEAKTYECTSSHRYNHLLVAADAKLYLSLCVERKGWSHQLKLSHIYKENNSLPQNKKFVKILWTLQKELKAGLMKILGHICENSRDWDSELLLFSCLFSFLCLSASFSMWVRHSSQQEAHCSTTSLDCEVCSGFWWRLIAWKNCLDLHVLHVLHTHCCL